MAVDSQGIGICRADYQLALPWLAAGTFNNRPDAADGWRTEFSAATPAEAASQKNSPVLFRRDHQPGHAVGVHRSWRTEWRSAALRLVYVSHHSQCIVGRFGAGHSGDSDLRRRHRLLDAV